MPTNEEIRSKREAAKEIIDVLQEISILLVCTWFAQEMPAL